ncbi:MAG: tetratricopeptide repeat protein [Bacteroidia bacterium]|nr:tetratricopeptide repeat protein [Bacteroidia bacterium]
MKGWTFTLFFSVLSAQSFLHVADSLLKQGRYAVALGLYDSLLRTRAMPDTLRLHVYLRGAEAWGGLNRPKEALNWIAPAESLALRLRDTLSYAKLLSCISLYHRQRRVYPDAEQALQAALRLVEAQGAQATPLYAILWRQWGMIAYDRGEYEKAESRYTRARHIMEEMRLTEHPDYVRTLSNLAVLYQDQGRYAGAETLYLGVREIGMKVLGTEHPDHLRTLMSLANLYKVQGRYTEAEALYLQVKEIRAKVLGTEHPDYARTLNNLANVYRAQGRYAEAEALHLQVGAIQAKAFGTDHPDYAHALGSLALVYGAQGRHAEAEKILLQVKAIQEKAFGTEHPYYLLTLHNLAAVYQAQRQYSKAETLFLQVKAAQAKVLGTEHPDYARTLNNLALIYRFQGRYAEAETLCLRAVGIFASSFGKEYSDLYLYSLYNLALLYQQQQRYTEADKLWTVVALQTFSRIRREFPTLPTAARKDLLENRLQNQLSDFQSYVAEHSDNPAIVELGYRSARSFKGVLLSSTEGMKRLVETSRDSALHTLYQRWKSLADRYAILTLQEDYEVADSLWREIQEVERAIVLKLPALKAFLPDPAGEPLLPPLRSNEALIEVVRAPASTEDSILYLFYLLLPRGKKHALHLYIHRVDTLWERRIKYAYEILRSPGAMVSGMPYKLLWAFIDSLLPSKVKAVYLSPDGVYYQINVGTLYDAERKQFVIDRYDLRYIASSRRLLLTQGRFPVQRSVVIGNPYFSILSDSLSELRTRSYRLFEAGVPQLPGAEVEAQGIAKLLGTQPVIGQEATESFLKCLQSPQVLHVATHGYFTEGGKNPLLAGGLLLAQAVVWDSLFPPLGVDDGRLTAQEASNLNLLGTELVVLSACETGLGEVRGEGLYGLQRAFLEAGARWVIAALWQVDDEATRELMLSFYRNWVKRKRGEKVDEIFNRTLRAFRAKHPEPYYWGAFVVMR